MPDYDDFDILALTLFVPLTGKLKSISFFQKTTYPLDTLHAFIVVPSPEPLNSMFYPLKPFSWEIWLGMAFFILYSTILLRISSIEHTLELGVYFLDFFKLSIAQSVSYKYHHALLSFCFVMGSLFGFIMNLWYGTILGSFLTTGLHDPPIKTFHDIRNRALKIAVPNKTLERWVFGNMTDITNIVQYVEYNQFKELLNSLDNRFAFSEDSNHWNYFTVPQMKHYHDPKFQRLKVNIASSFLRIIYNPLCIYKKKLNRVILLLQDVGLFKHYKERVFFYNLKYKYVNYTLKTPRVIIQTLKLNYFKYVFLVLCLGYLVGFTVFLMELFKFVIFVK